MIKYKKNHYNCSVCGGNSFSKIYGVSVFNICACRICGVVCLNPRMSEEDYMDYYRSQYYRNYISKTEVKKLYSKNFKNIRGIKIFNDLKNYITIKSRIIEIGCGNGENLAMLKSKGFNNLIGLDPSLECSRELQKIYGIKFFNQSLSKFAIEFNDKEKFDCVILSHVLEHFVEPDKSLRTIANIIKPEGIIYILVPHLYGFKNPFSQFCIPHTFYFSNVTIEALLKNSGLAVERYFESPSKDEIIIFAKKTNKPLVFAINNSREYERVLVYLNRNKMIYIKAMIRRGIEEFIIKVFGEDIYLYIRNFFKNIKLVCKI